MVEKNKIISSLIWKLLEKTGVQGMQFIIQIVLARLLAPEQFGTIAIVLVFISIANVFVHSGLNVALIQDKNSDKVDFSSVFYLSLFLATILYIVIFFTSPLISVFFDKTILVPVLRIMGITLFFGAFNGIQNAYIAKNLLFKKLFITSLIATLVSGLIGVIFALNGYGIWALVIQQLLNQILITIVLLVIIKWRPKLVFSFIRVKILFSFGWKLLVSALLNMFYLNIRTLIIGKIYSPTILGYYNRGEQFPRLIVRNIDGSIQSVMLPSFSAYQDDIKTVKKLVKRTIVSSSFLIFPMMIGMAVVAEPLVITILTEKWVPAVPFLRIFSISYALIPIHSANLQAINAMGRSDIFLKVELIKKLFGILILIVSLFFGIYAIALGLILSGLLATAINAYPNRKLINYGYYEQIIDILPAFIIAVLMGVFVYTLNMIGLPPFSTLIIQIFAGTLFYFGSAIILKIEGFTYLIKSGKEFLSKRKNC
ncbi:MAG: lipopolysaccharide biosynthesis protein [Halanaerobiales bacterium]|nr:lipopolysaccharide biosynthesis protein [Halanaerobiales bacterium]